MSAYDASLEQFAAAVLASVGSSDVETVIRQALERLDPAHLPLQLGLSGTSYAIDTQVTAMIIRVVDDLPTVQVRAGLFYTGVLSGCSCADDPTPVDEQNEYCEVWLEVDKATGHVRVTLASESEAST